MKIARERYGFRTAVLPEVEPLPFADGAFDLVFCSSVIEHATLDKRALREVAGSALFRGQAFAHQRRFADELRRVGGRYSSSAHRYFPIESHTWLPALILLLPRRRLIQLIDFTNAWWPKKTRPDWNLLTRRQMRELFPDADLLMERWLGLPKSLIAIGGRAFPAALEPRARASGPPGTSES